MQCVTKSSGTNWFLTSFLSQQVLKNFQINPGTSLQLAKQVVDGSVREFSTAAVDQHVHLLHPTGPKDFTGGLAGGQRWWAHWSKLSARPTANVTTTLFRQIGADTFAELVERETLRMSDVLVHPSRRFGLFQRDVADARPVQQPESCWTSGECCLPLDCCLGISILPTKRWD